MMRPVPASSSRTLPPLLGAPTPVRLPAVTRDELGSGLRVWSLPWRTLPVVTVGLLFDAGAAQDPPALPGLASLTGDLLDEGAGGRSVIALSDAFAKLGTYLETEVGHDMSVLSFTTLSRNFEAALALLADVVMRPHLAEDDLRRIRQLRVNRLRQLKTSAGAAADRAFLRGVFASHPYGHGTLGTTRALEAATLDDVRAFHADMFAAPAATLVVVGDVAAPDVMAAARAHFDEWRRERRPPALPVGVPEPSPACLLVDRPGAPQSELRIGHFGPPRGSSAFHALVTLNAALGGQFTSRINQQLRETKGYTYGARTGFDFHRTGSTFSCDTSVQADATAEAAADVLGEFSAVRSHHPIRGDELERAQSSLTRGYVRHFETPAHLLRAAAELLKFGLPDDTFDAFVPAVAALTAEAVLDAAQRFLQPDACVIAVVGDAEKVRPGLAQLGRAVADVTPEF